MVPLFGFDNGFDSVAGDGTRLGVGCDTGDDYASVDVIGCVSGCGGGNDHVADSDLGFGFGSGGGDGTGHGNGKALGHDCGIDCDHGNGHDNGLFLMTTIEWRRKADDALRQLTTAREALKKESRALEAARVQANAIEEARGIAQAVAESVQRQAHRRIADVVSKCLEAVFDEPYQLEMKFEQKRGRTEVSLVFVRDGLEVDPVTASGGGVVDVASFALRLAALLLSKPPLRRLLVLDEPFKFVSAEYRVRVRQMLEMLAKEMGVQVLMVTHIDELRTGTVVEL